MQPVQWMLCFEITPEWKVADCQMYRMLVLDLDGTLLNEDKHVSPENASAIRRAHQQGLTVVVATGRPPVGTRQARAELGGVSDEYLITYNGALIQNARSGETYATHMISLADFKAVQDLTRGMDVFAYAFDLGHVVSTEPNTIIDWESQINGIPIRYIDLEKESPAAPLVKIMVNGTPESLDSFTKIVPESYFKKYSVFRSMSFLLEFLNPLASKGQAVRDLAAHLGISREDIICIGDSENDEDMIRYAGLGVAMGNATEAIKAAADYVTRSNDIHGVAHVINKFIKNQ